MLLYGYHSKFSLKSYSNLKKIRNEKTSKLNLPLQTSIRINYVKFNISIPDNWKCIVFVKLSNCTRAIFLYSNIYFLQFSIPSNRMQLQINLNASLIQLTTIYTNNFQRLFWNNLVLLFSCFNKPLFLKIKFKGKGYYIFKDKRQTITPQFGYAHRLYLYTYFVSVKFLSKTNIFLFGLLKSDLVLAGWRIKQMRSINIFTGRGVRFSKQTIYKKVGKVSSYR